VILKFYSKVYFSDIEACQGLHLFPLCDVIYVIWCLISLWSVVICLSIRLFLCLPICLSIYPSIYHSGLCLWCVWRWSVKTNCVQSCVSMIHASISPSIHLSICLAVYLSLWSVLSQEVIGEDKLHVILCEHDPCVCLSIHPPVYPSVYLSVYHCGLWWVRRWSVKTSFVQSYVTVTRASVCLFIQLSIYLSVYPSICLSVYHCGLWCVRRWSVRTNCV